MLHKLLRTKKFIPNEYHDSFFDIDFNRLSKEGYKTILCDLDNTLISYDEEYPTEEILNKFKELESLGFEIILISNNVPSRIETFLEGTDIIGFANARKPLLIGIKKAHKHAEVKDVKRTILIGDQLMTDIWAANRYKAYAILVNPIKKKTEKWYTKINRKIEEKMILKIGKKFPNKYKDLHLDKRN